MRKYFLLQIRAAGLENVYHFKLDGEDGDGEPDKILCEHKTFQLHSDPCVSQIVTNSSNR